MKNKTFDVILITFIIIVINVVALFPEISGVIKYKMDLEIYQNMVRVLSDKTREDEILLEELKEEESKNQKLIEMDNFIQDYTDKIKKRYEDIDSLNNEINNISQKIYNQKKANENIEAMFE